MRYLNELETTQEIIWRAQWLQKAAITAKGGK